MDTSNRQPIVATPGKSLWQYFISAYTENYVNFKGRARRREFWGFVLFYNLIGFVAYFFLYLIAGVSVFSRAYAGDPSPVGIFFPSLISFIMCVFALASLLPSLGVSVRRLHDRGYSGKWYLAYLLAGVLSFPFFLLAGVGSLLDSDSSAGGFIVIAGLLIVVAMGLGIFLFLQYVQDGDREANKYGESPKYQPIDEYVAKSDAL